MKIGDLVKLPSVDDYASQGLKYWWSGKTGIVIEKDTKGIMNHIHERYERDECRVLIGDRWCWFAEEGLERVSESQ